MNFPFSFVWAVNNCIPHGVVCMTTRPSMHQLVTYQLQTQIPHPWTSAWQRSANDWLYRKLSRNWRQQVSRSVDVDVHSLNYKVLRPTSFTVRLLVTHAPDTNWTSVDFAHKTLLLPTLYVFRTTGHRSGFCVVAIRLRFCVHVCSLH